MKSRKTLSLLFPCWIYLEKINRLAVSGFVYPSSSSSSLHRRHHLPFCSIQGRSTSRALVARVENDPTQVIRLENNENPLERKFMSYTLNIQRERQSGELKAVRSMVNYLRTHHFPFDDISNSSLMDLLERAFIQGLRLSGEVGDYRLLLQLVDSIISYSNGQPILRPRIFGETLGSLGQTHANASKMKQIWNLVCKEENVSFLTSPLTAFELNVMMKSLNSRNTNKARACLELYRQHTDPSVAKQNGLVYIRPDAYTSSTILSILTDSIKVDQIRDDPKIFEPLVSLGRTERQKKKSSTEGMEESLRRLTYSTCWQWNAAVDILLPTLRDPTQWNNFAYGSLLQLQDRAQELMMRGGHENGPQVVLTIFDTLMKEKIRPDIVTCTLVIKGMGDPYTDPESWKLAVQFLERLKTDPQLPDPNEYSYSAAIVACARCHEYTTALNLLKEMRMGTEIENSSFIPPKPNTWIYNAVLAAIVSEVDDRQRSKGGHRSSSRNENDSPGIDLAMNLLQQMKDDHHLLSLQTRPDTVTYNTILGMKGLSMRSELIDEMKTDGIERDVITYRNAVSGSTDAGAILTLLKQANEDLTGSSTAPTGGIRSKDMLSIYNAALSTSSLQNDFKTLTATLQIMAEEGIHPDSVTLVTVIKVLSSNGKLQALLDILRTLHTGDMSDNVKSQKVAAALGVSSFRIGGMGIDVSHYVAAIESSLLAGRLEDARQILSLMRENQVEPTSACLQSFAMAYAQSAIRIAGRKLASKKKDESLSIAASKAHNAYQIAVALKELSPEVLAVIAQACAKTQQWSISRTMLRNIHQQMLGSGIPWRQREVKWIRGVHSTLLRECTLQGNITAALEYTSDIQNFALRSHGTNKDKSVKLDAEAPETEVVSPIQELQKHDMHSSYVGMRAADWVVVIKCASTAGHWKVCVNTLQFLKSHVLRTNPKKVKGDDAATLESRYEQLAPALTATCICLEKRSQYAWGERVLTEWMKWSGRQPRPEAVLATVRNLSERGRGEEVKILLSQCIDPKNPNPGKYTRDGVGYEEMIYNGAITALHNNGMYDDADEVFLIAISHGYLPFVFGKQPDDDRFVLDLHGVNVALAHSTVRVALRRLASENQEEVAATRAPLHMMIITGRGRNSALWMRPVIRPEVQRMLLEEFYPPLNTVSIPGNTGALMVYSNDISAWQAHQQEQKGLRMLTLARLLKSASTDRIQKIATKLGRVDT